ncbi:invasion associated locus B family protein [Muricoccus pecuniae]|uniref:Invasion protein IalB, involved in pathogenesis n=1 Tax=Muricoccus pecuniae TaxID=693023 RepID=A0A840Y759_9PROT|nr:hypothetical protein [Roseomonas pecuniae]MBB5694599.1 hypothetical protein [Roseomonas pecuniae]
MMRLVAPLLAILAAGPALAQGGAPATGGAPGGVTETFGPWLLSCAMDRMTDNSACRMLHRRPVEPASAGMAALALEVEDRGGRLVPVVAARDLSLEGAARGVLALTGTVQLRFPPSRLFEMPCGLEGRSLVCAPREADLARAAAELPGADRVLLRVTGLLVPDAQAMREPVELPLSDTPAALARLRARQPEGTAPPPPPAWLDLREMLSRLMSLLGPLGAP